MLVTMPWACTLALKAANSAAVDAVNVFMAGVVCTRSEVDMMKKSSSSEYPALKKSVMSSQRQTNVVIEN
jgi:hypothetical protein